MGEWKQVDGDYGRLFLSCERPNVFLNGAFSGALGLGAYFEQDSSGSGSIGISGKNIEITYTSKVRMKFRRSIILSPFKTIRIYIHIGSLSAGVSAQMYYANASAMPVSGGVGFVSENVYIAFRNGNDYVVDIPLSRNNTTSETVRNQQARLEVMIDIDSSKTSPKIQGGYISRIDMLN